MTNTPESTDEIYFQLSAEMQYLIWKHFDVLDE